MSATLDLEKFKKYFNSECVVQIPGRTFKIEVYNTLLPQIDYLNSMIRAITQIICFEEVVAQKN